MSTFLIVLLKLFELAVIVRVLLRPHREPTSRVAWVAVIAALPIVGVVAYLLVGETSVGKKRQLRVRAILDRLPPFPAAAEGEAEHLTPEAVEKYNPLFELGTSISGFLPIGGNCGRLSYDSNATIKSMVADIDAATEHVHLSFYIWLTDGNGLKVAEALKRAAGRGVKCRALADALGSRAMIASEHWQAMQQAGVHVAAAMPMKNASIRPSGERLDLRNHRKIVVIDDWITYCGSQNCADPEFRVKPKFAPWVDAMIRFQGPVARQNQYLFVSDWMSDVDEDLRDMLSRPVRAPEPGFTAEVVGTGPTIRASAMPELFASLMYAARRELVITTPYYVPNPLIQAAQCSAAYRGVKTTIIFPARNDSPMVAAASRSYYRSLLDAGVEIHEYVGGLLHTKSLTLDGEVTLIGSANMDRRSFDLNYENNILFHDPALTADVRGMQDHYLASSRPVSAEDVDAWPMTRRLWNNVMGTLGPLL